MAMSRTKLTGHRVLHVSECPCHHTSFPYNFSLKPMTYYSSTQQMTFVFFKRGIKEFFK